MNITKNWLIIDIRDDDDINKELGTLSVSQLQHLYFLVGAELEDRWRRQEETEKECEA